MSLPEEYLKDPEDYLPMVGPVPGSNIRWNIAPDRPVGELPLTGVGKYVGQVARGATLGLLGDPMAPANLPQTLAEGAGMAAPFALGMAGAGPALGAAAPI